MAKAILYDYNRFSSAKQAKGDSMRRQKSRRKELERWCADRDIIIDHSLTLDDRGLSAYRGLNAKKGALAVFLKAIETGAINPGDYSDGAYLCVENLDRISRQKPRAAQRLISEILDAGVHIAVWAPDGIKVYRSDDDSMQAAIEIVFEVNRAHGESKRKSELVGAAWRHLKERARNGEVKVSANGPAWLQLSRDRKHWIQDRPMVDLVCRIFDMAETQGVTAICRQLNAEKAPTLGRAKYWGRSSLRSLLRDRKTLGEYQPKQYSEETGKLEPIGEPILNYYDPIISPKQFANVQAATEARRTRIKGGPNVDRCRNLFTGIACDTKNEPYVFEESNTGTYQRLYLRAPRNKARDALTVPYDLIEATMVVWAHDIARDVSQLVTKRGKAVSRVNLQNQLADVKAQIADFEARLKKDRKKYKGLLDNALPDAYAERDELAGRLKTLEVETRNTATAAAKDLKAILRETRKVENLEQRRLLRAAIGRLVERLTISGRKVGGGQGHYELTLVAELTNGQTYTVAVDGTRVWWKKGLAKGAKFAGGKNHELMKEFPELETFQSAGQQFAELKRLREKGLTFREIAERLGITVSCAKKRYRRINRA